MLTLDQGTHHAHGDPLIHALALTDARNHCDACRAYAAETDRLRESARRMRADADQAHRDMIARGWAWRGIPDEPDYDAMTFSRDGRRLS